MTETQRAAMQQALDTLEGWDNYGKWVWPESALEQARRNTTEALTALRAALAEPEPVAETSPARRPLTPAQEAAPELLAALREVLDIAESLADATHVNRGERAALRSAAKIIAKAGGTR